MTIDQEVQFTFTHSSGPGGQNVNKVNSKAILRWNPTRSKCIDMTILQRLIKIAGKHCTSELDIVIMSDRYRDQPMNKADCLEKLHAMINKASNPPPRRKKTKPSRTSVREKHESKKKHSAKKAARRKTFRD